MLPTRHATRTPMILASPAAREVIVTAVSMAGVVWWVVGEWAAVPLLICLGLVVVKSVAFGVQVGVRLARRGEGEADGSAVAELLACLGAK